MSIRALPSDTTRLLGAAVQLVNPLSLVKELVDNALDAGASTIEVRISPNTVDKIEVRDDGHGIQPADFPALGRRGHTSKLASFDDLGRVGGISLGFRGEGLAAANSLGYVSVTTRAADAVDPMASAFSLARGAGGIAHGSCKAVAAPIGTVVTVTCLFSAFPVRRMTAIRDAGKTLSALKTLLSGYALARPRRLRVVLRVLQQPTPAWQVSPRPLEAASGKTCHEDDEACVREVVLALFGPDIVRQCHAVTVSAVGSPASGLLAALSPSTTASSSSHPEYREFLFEAFLPKPGADLAKLSFGGFVSVDGRPLAAQKYSSTAKKLLAIFREHLGKAALQQPPPPHRLREAFLRLNIKCPPGSYDPNVEAAKTDVLFADERFVCDAFERLCAQVYGEAARNRVRTLQLQPSPPSSLPSTSSSHQLSAERPLGSNSLSLRKRQAVSCSSSHIEHDHLSSSPPAFASQDKRSQRQATQRDVPLVSPPPQAPQSIVPTRRAAPVSPLGVQTPPPSSPMESIRPRRLRLCGQSLQVCERSHRHIDLSGRVSRDRYRQTTISFGGPSTKTGQSLAPQTPQQATERAIHSDRRSLSAAAKSPTPSPGTVDDASLPTFETASERHRRHQTAPTLSAISLDHAKVNRISQRDEPRATREAGAGLGERPNCVVEVCIEEIERAAAQNASRKTAWGGSFTDLSPGTVDILELETRLKSTIVKWLARTAKAARTQGSATALRGTVRVEFYLRRGLKKKALQSAQQHDVPSSETMPLSAGDEAFRS